MATRKFLGKRFLRHLPGVYTLHKTATPTPKIFLWLIGSAEPTILAVTHPLDLVTAPAGGNTAANQGAQMTGLSLLRGWMKFHHRTRTEAAAARIAEELLDKTDNFRRPRRSFTRM
jgi:hypothetical protein